MAVGRIVLECPSKDGSLTLVKVLWVGKISSLGLSPSLNSLAGGTGEIRDLTSGLQEHITYKAGTPGLSYIESELPEPSVDVRVAVTLGWVFLQADVSL